jgi:hypothetical protein
MVTDVPSSASEPGKGQFRADMARTRQRCEELDRYHGASVQSGNDFICASANGCRASHQGAFYSAQLHHVGRHYDLALNGLAMRIVVTGQEYGGPPSNVTRNMRSDMVAGASGCRQRFFRSGSFPARNPHMRGTTSLLRLLFGSGLGSDYEGEFLQVEGHPVHMFECFALINFLLCSAVRGPEREWNAETSKSGAIGRSTAVMRRNCARHYRRAIEILEPTVIVAQGRGVRRWMRQVIDHAEPAHASLPIERVAIGPVGAHLLTFTHPACPTRDNWGMNDRQPYLLETVAPTVGQLAALVRAADSRRSGPSRRPAEGPASESSP